MKYRKRIIDNDLNSREQAFGGINIVGPKGCGKTRTAKERCKSIVEFQNEDKRDSLLYIAEISPSSLLNDKKPILFDEWQDAPKIWGTVRAACDNEDCFGEYYLTGSSSKYIDTPHSGTSRISTVEMLPMSLYESGESNGLISLSGLFNNQQTKIDGIKNSLDIPGLIYPACRGGWPKTLAIKSKEAKLLVAKDYFKQIFQEDISRIDHVKRNPDWARAILKSYARNAGTLVKKEVIYKDASSSTGMSEDTFDIYVDKLKQLYVIDDIEAWYPQIRSEKALRSPLKRMFIDPSIAIAALGVSPSYFIHNLDTFGHIFESLVFRDLKIYSSSFGGTLSHYHDAYGLEVDGVLHLEDGRYALVEIKLGGQRIQSGIDNELKICRLIKEANEKGKGLKIPEPSFLMVVTGTEYAYRSREGVFVVPIGCLKD
ncbi:MAG: DUF4143 domain-containing protein [Bacilli bacterium]|jgi:predicted AAA+ superfamily ATPase|nr:DUF4143 domain-containing protein [Bacilli bacterium]